MSQKRSSKPKKRIRGIERRVSAYIDTIRYKILLDSGMTIIGHDRDLYTFSNMGNMDVWHEYREFEDANRKALRREEQKPYKY